MRTLNRLSVIFVLSLFGLNSCKSGSSLSKEEIADNIKAKIDSVNYTFSPQTALPMGGRSVNLTLSYYSLKVSKDTVKAQLPYFGRAYVAPTNLQDGGIKFVSTDFNYNVAEKKNGDWEISITTNDTQPKVDLRLSVSDNGYSTLYVLDNNRQPISFYGKIED